MIEYREHVPAFNLASRVHDDHSLAELRDHTQVVGDEQDGRIMLSAESIKQVQDLRFQGDVERGSRFVGNQHRGLERQGGGDHYPLAHATGEFMGVTPDPFVRVGDSHLSQRGDRAIARAAARLPAVLLMRPLGIDHLRTNGEGWIQASEWILKDDRDLTSAQVTQTIGGGLSGRQDWGLSG